MRRSIIAGALVLPLMLHAAGFWWNVIRDASYPFQHDYGEGIVLYQASKITDPNVAYKPISTYPYVVFHYPPLYHLVCTRVLDRGWQPVARGPSRVCDVSGADRGHHRISGVHVSSGPFRSLAPPGPGLACGVAADASRCHEMDPVARVDMLAVLLSFAGLGLFVLARRTPIWQVRRVRASRGGGLHEADGHRRVHRVPPGRLGLVGSFMLVAAFAVSLSCGKAGSSYNYFIEWNLVCCLLAGLVVHRCWSMPWCKALVLFAAVGLPIVILAFRLPMRIRGLLPRSTAAHALEEVRIETHAAVTKLIRDARGPVFSEDMLLLVEAGKDVPAEPAILRELATTGLWDERLFTRQIDGQRFEFLVIENLYDPPRYTPAVVAAIEAAYAETRKVLHFEIYEPRVSKSP